MSTSPVESLDPLSPTEPRFVFLLGLFVSLLACGLLLYSVGAAAAPWRDEVNSIQMARMPWSELWQQLRADTLPMGLHVVLKGWLALFPPGQDILAIRSLGALVGLGCIAAFWWTTKQLRGGVPTLCLVFFFFNPDFVRAIGTVRPYGFSVLLLLLLCGAWYRYRESGKTADWMLATCCAVGAAHMHYLNLLYLTVIWLGLSLLLLKGREWRRWYGLSLVALLAGFSMLPYLPVLVASRGWANMLMYSREESTQLHNAWQVWSAGGASATYLALFVVVFALFYRVKAQIWPEAALLGLCLAGLCLPVYLACAFVTNSAVSPWYLGPPAALACLGFQLLISQGKLASTIAKPMAAPRSQTPHVSGGYFGLRIGVPACTIMVAALMFPAALRGAGLRQTNLDVAAQMLSQAATPQDYIVVSPWYYGVGFQYFYRGNTPWQTLPPLPDHTMHRFDLIHAAIMTSNGGTFSATTLQQMRATLRSGAKVWLLGKPQKISAPPGPENWIVPASLPLQDRYAELEMYWTAQAVAVAQEEGAKILQVDLGSSRVNPYEDAGLYQISVP